MPICKHATVLRICFILRQTRRTKLTRPYMKTWMVVQYATVYWAVSEINLKVGLVQPHPFLEGKDGGFSYKYGLYPPALRSQAHLLQPSSILQIFASSHLLHLRIKLVRTQKSYLYLTYHQSCRLIWWSSSRPH